LWKNISFTYSAINFFIVYLKVMKFLLSLLQRDVREIQHEHEKKYEGISIERNCEINFFRSRICLTNYFVKVTAIADRVKPADRPRLMMNLIIESPFDFEARWCDGMYRDLIKYIRTCTGCIEGKMSIVYYCLSD